MSENLSEGIRPMKGPGFAAFIDLHDSTYAWDQNAEKASEIVRDLYKIVESEVDRSGGCVGNFTGDGFLLLFSGIETAVFCLSRIISRWEPERAGYLDKYTSGGISAPDRFFLRLRTGVSFGNFGPLRIKAALHYSGSGINKAQRCEAASKEYFHRESIGPLKAPNYVFIDSSAENLIQARSDFYVSGQLPASFKGYFQAGTSAETAEPQARGQFIYAVWPRAAAEAAGKSGEELQKLALAQTKADIGDRLLLASHAVKSAEIFHTLSDTASGQNRVKLIEEAIASYRVALENYPPGTSPVEYIKTQMRLGAALRYHAGMLSGPEKHKRLNEAAIAQREAIKYASPSVYPADFAVAQSNLGNILRNHAGLLAGGEKHAKLEDAITAYREALRVDNPEDRAADRAMIQNNLGNALSDHTGSFSGTEKINRFEAAITAYRAALSFYSLMSDPIRYAGTQNNLGTALKNLALLFDGEPRLTKLEEAGCAYREALKVYTPDADPVSYALTCNNLGRYSREKASLLTGEARKEELTAAVKAYKTALGVFSADSSPEYFAVAQSNLGDALTAFARESSGEARTGMLSEAAAAYTSAMLIYTPAAYPDRHQKLQSKLADLGHAA